MRLKTLEINGFKSFAQKSVLDFGSPVTCVVGPNGSGKSNVVEAFRYVLGEQSMKSMRGKSGLDLIFKGSKSLSKGTSAQVKIYFDNSDKIFKLSNENGENIDLNYDTICISREVYADGLNKYILNGSEVRLKDIHNLLSSLNIGSSGHHIISQGEADRILNANSRERREMIEDALGLKVYQYKIKESEKKLERTETNMKEVGILRRENAPHLNFLKRQVEKFERAKDMQIELGQLYMEYLKKESIFLEKEKSNLTFEKHKVLKELEDVSGKISDEEEAPTKGNKKIEELREIENKLNEIRNLKAEISRKLGRIEGMIEGETRRKEVSTEVVALTQREMEVFIEEINFGIDEAISKNTIDEIKPILDRIKNILQSLNKNKKEQTEEKINLELEALQATQTQILKEIEGLERKEKEFRESVENVKNEINTEMEALRDLEKEKFKFKVKYQELSSALGILNLKEENLHSRAESFENEIKEGAVLIGREILSYKDFVVKDPDFTQGSQDELKRRIERIKIKLEDAGLGNASDIMKEFKEVTERDEFLQKEIEDLTQSIESLNVLIKDLKEKIDIEFKEGIKKINVEFQEFFSLMFGGGHGHLSVVVENKRKKKDEDGEFLLETDEELVFEQGIEIDVSLPHKKVKELHALSGGERSLTSIAILFAMSQVNPPPFLVLDETDAALDEANSRKYGDMIEKLSKHSQLIVVTHNRETMSRAGVLYGVTIASNGASKLLSVKFDEATQIAK
ncbi:MAG: AAA family ATPase [Patescibacteria group bacterium]